MGSAEPFLHLHFRTGANGTPDPDSAIGGSVGAGMEKQGSWAMLRHLRPCGNGSAAALGMGLVLMVGILAC